MNIKDNYKDGKLFYGINGTKYRNNILAVRKEEFLNCLLDDYPELFLYFNDSNFQYKLHSLRYISFKDINKLIYSMYNESLESVTFNEFYILIQRFKKYLSFNPNSKKELSLIYKSSRL